MMGGGGAAALRVRGSVAAETSDTAKDFVGFILALNAAVAGVWRKGYRGFVQKMVGPKFLQSFLARDTAKECVGLQCRILGVFFLLHVSTFATTRVALPTGAEPR
jgi:hypothetical protein